MTIANNFDSGEGEYTPDKEFVLDKHLENRGTGFNPDGDLEDMIAEVESKVDTTGDEEDFLSNNYKEQNHGSLQEEYTEHPSAQNNETHEETISHELSPEYSNENHIEVNDTIHHDEILENHDNNIHHVPETNIIEEDHNIQENYYSPSHHINSENVEYTSNDMINDNNYSDENSHNTQMNLPKNDSGSINGISDVMNEENIHKIVSILDTYRGLTSQEKAAVPQFIRMSDGNIPEGETQLIYAVLNVDDMTSQTMSALRETKEKEPVERAFFVIELDEQVFYALGDLVSALTDENFDRHEKKTQYARKLVHSIDNLDGTVMQYVTASEKVLNASQG